MIHARNTAVLLVDHQVGLFTGVRNINVNELKHNVVGLARAARALGLPIVAVTTARDSMWGPTIPELKAVLGDNDILDRSTVNAWDDERFVTEVNNTGRDHLIIAGLSFEVCASLPAISAREHGFHPVVVVDACSTFSHHKREAGLARSDQPTTRRRLIGISQLVRSSSAPHPHRRRRHRGRARAASRVRPVLAD